MEKFFKKIKSAFPKAIVQFEKNYVSFTFGGGLYYQLRVQKDKVRMMATNYPNKAKLGECIKIIRKNKIEGQEINGKEIIFEIGVKNPEIFTLRLEMPYAGTQLENDKFNAGIVDSCAKFHEVLLPLVNAFLKQPVGDLYSLMGGKIAPATAKVEQVKAAPKKVSAKPKVTLQQQLADALIEHFPDAIIKKINTDNYLDIHLPSVHQKKGTHLGINTAKELIKIIFYCREDEFNEQVLANSKKIEAYAQGLRIKDNPTFNTIEKAIDASVDFVKELKRATSKTSKKTTSIQSKKQPLKENVIKPAKEGSDFKSMIKAYKAGDLKKVADLVEKGNRPLQFNQDDSVIENELIAVCAAEEVVLDVLKRIIKEGGDLNARNNDEDKYTAVHYCAWDGKTKALTLLLKSGALPDIVGADGRTPLHLATAMGHSDAVELLIKAGVDIDRRIPDGNKYYSKKGATALREALINQRWEVVDLLLGAEAEITSLTELCVEDYKGKKDLFDVIKLLAEDGEYSDGDFDEEKLNELENRVKGIASEDEEEDDEEDQDEAVVEDLEEEEENQEDEEEEVDEDQVEEVSNLEDYDIRNDLIINGICRKIKSGKYLTNLLYINKTLSLNGYETDNHQAYFFDSKVIISDRELEGFLVVNMDGFYSNCMDEDKMQMIFSWSGVNDIEYEEDGDDCSLDIVAEQGRLTIKKEGSHSLKVLYTFYKNVWERINDEFKDQSVILWNQVWEMGINEVSFSEFNDYLTFDISQSDDELAEGDESQDDETEEIDDDGEGEKLFFIGKDYELEFASFLKIAEETGIITNNIKGEPSQSDRDKLWDIARAFAERIYQLDEENNPDKEELNTLCFYAIVALHWCDIYITDERFSRTNGRFRRDTLALALCFYARIDRSYDYYDHVKMQFIMPHMHFSVLLWTVNSIVNIGQDNLLAMFSPEQALKAQQLFTEMDKKNQASGVFGIIDPSKMPDNHPLKAIWNEIFSLFRNVRIPFQFIRNYISLELPKRSFIQNLLSKEGKNKPGVNVTLLDIDKQKNIAFLDRQIEHKQFPADWVFVHDIAFISIYFATTTDADLDNEEMNIILTQIGEWINEADQKKLKKLSTDAFNKAKEQFRRDKSNERFSFALENIRRQILVQKKYDIDETKKQLQIILNDLLAIAEADNDVKSEEVDLVVAIRDNWGIVWDSGEEQNENVIEVDEDEQDVEELEQNDFDVDEKISEFYCDNVWEREYYDLDKKPFPDVIRNQEDLDLLFRKFTTEEVDLIVKKIKKTKTYILLPFIKEILGRDMDLSSYKPPFWFIPIVAYGNNISSILYFNQDGIYNTFKNSSSLSMAINVDVWKSISVEPGYNGLFDDDSDDDTLSSLKIDWYNPNSGNSGATNVVEFHGEEYGASLKILMAIWNYAWKDVVDRSKGASQFLLGPPPFLESFNNWDELIEWAKKK